MLPDLKPKGFMNLHDEAKKLIACIDATEVTGVQPREPNSCDIHLQGTVMHLPDNCGIDHHTVLQGVQNVMQTLGKQIGAENMRQQQEIMRAQFEIQNGLVLAPPGSVIKG